MTSGVPEAFGFVPAHVVADLQDIGNWKSRATAIDLLHKALKDVSRPQNLVESLPDFVKFLVGLIADPNFKIAISSMSILGELAGKVGNALDPQLSVVVPALLEKFTDSKILVRAANMKAIKKLMGATSPGGVLELLALGSSHTSWRVREEVLNTHIMAMLSFGRNAYQPTAVYSLMRAGMADGKDKVRLVALEGMAVLGAKAGRAELTALMAGQKPGGAALPDAHKREVISRLSNSALPTINGDGLVEHCVELPAAAGAEAADMRLADAAFGGAGGTKLPWGDPSTPPRPRLRTAATSDHPGSSSANGRERPAGPGAGPGGGGAEGGPPAGRRQASALNLDIRSGPSIVFQHGHGAGVEAGGESGLWSPSYRPVPVPGAAFGHPPSRLGSHESFTAGAAYGGGGGAGPGAGGGGGGYPISAASGWSLSAARPPPLHVIERPASPLREAVSGGQLPAVSHPLLSLPSESSQERNSAGSAPPHGRDLHTPSALQPLKHHWGATRSIEGQPAALKNPLESSEESPLSPAARSFQPLLTSRGSAPGVAPSEMAAAAAGNHHHHSHNHVRGDGLEYIPRPSSVRTQAAAELRESRDPRAPPAHSLSHPPLGAVASTAPGGGGGGAPHSSSAMALWLHQNGIDDHTASRQETFSPSKAEMLARLKVRQIEKRAATAQIDPPPGSHGDLLLSSANDIAPIASSHGSITGVPPGRRHLFTQLSDNQRDRGGGGAGGAGAGGGGADRGYNSVLNTPTRAGGAPPSPFDETPASARPPRTGLAARLGRATPMAVDPGSGGASSRSPTLTSPGYAYASASPAASEDSPARPLAPASPALNRLRARSADVTNLHPPNTPGGGSGGGPGGGGPGPGPGGAPGTPGGSGGPFWEKGRGGGDMPTEELAPLQDPDKHIRVVIAKLIEANNADRKELDWQGQYEALIDARRLVRHHTDVVRACLHEFVRAATPAIDQLRSQTSKCALMLFSECFVLLGRAMDRELDEMVPVLVKKAGEVSNAGRDNFLAEAADRTLAEMCRCCGEGRCTAALLGVSAHKNPYVRGKVAYHLDCHMEACAGGARQSLANNPAVVERVFRAGAAFLDEGGLDTRTYGKRIIWHVKAMLSSRADFDRLVHSVTPESLHRKVVDTVEGLNGPPPPPSRAVAGGVPGSRLASRQLGPGGTPASPMRPILDGPMGGGGGGGGAGAGGTGGGMGGSLTQNPPPMRQSSYSAPSPLGAGAGGATPERRRGLGRQRTSDLDGIPEGSGSGNTSGNGRMPPRSAAAGVGVGGAGGAHAAGSLSARGSSGSGAVSGDGGGGGFGPAVQETVVKSLLMLTAKDFRERIEALRMVEGVVGALPGAPDSLLIQLLDALVARLGDANAKVSMAAMELVGQLAAGLRSRISLSLNTLVPALAAGLGAGNDKIRGAALAATDALLGAVDPAMLVQHFSHVVGNGTIQRGKPLLVDKLVAIAGALAASKPQLVARYAVPAAFALLNDSKGGEAKAAANALLGALARMMGPALLEQAGGLNAVAQQRVADAVAAASGQAPAGGLELRRGGSFKDREVGGGADRPWAPRR
ncbi:hypothetical protein HXX76_004967 [Chlamydomonas incerta]|uniref:TOG domain-containing protein n=1 Tax=Chlamydomonas incerta TaxID=51695 RepID=A0A835W511_CHLIN|nr:hypothetical protein HXX76_004967 [Chlamydomonas incerta]|eukprot:KAG2439615.1 hypothetical protein HXX76_004967 [Chlamydomonas incerta]